MPPASLEPKWAAVLERIRSHPHEDTSWIVRLGAPLPVLSAWLEADPRAITHVDSQRGTILHDAWKSSARVFGYLFERVLASRDTEISTSALLVEQDRHGRTILHHLMEQPETLWIAKILSLSPEAAQIVDNDGYTPLMVLLDYSHAQGRPRWSHQKKLYQAVAAILSCCPDSGATGRPLPRPWRFHIPYAETKTGVSEEGSFTSLYYALLNGHSPHVIQLLLRTNPNIASRIVTPHHEVALHIAVTTRAPLGIVNDLVRDAPEAVLIPDVYGLTPLDWLWIRHVLDTNANPDVDFQPSRVISRRRMIPVQYTRWNNECSNRDRIQTALRSDAKRQAIENLMDRIVAFLSANSPSANTGRGKTHLHSMCSVPCPIGMVRTALEIDSNSSVLHVRESAQGRLPLHCASELSVAYHVAIPVSFRQTTTHVAEPVFAALHEVLLQFPPACRVRDHAGQLPLHIVIDAAKRGRTNDGCSELEAIQQLLLYYPASLRRRDGVSRLFPWQQAAIGNGSSLAVIYSLLRREPALLEARTSAHF